MTVSCLSTQSFKHTPHIKVALLFIYTYICMELEKGIRKLRIPGGLGNHCMTFKVPIYDVIR